MATSSEALQQRDAGAWDAFYKEHAQEIYGFVHRLVPAGRPATDEVFQEIWLEAMEDIHRFDPRRGEIRTWLFAIARQRVALYWRKHASRKGAISFTDRNGEFEIDDDGALLPDEILEQVERNAAVNAALLVLPPDRRELLLQKYVEGLSVREIAEQAGKSVKSVESLLARGRDQLRALLGRYLTDAPRGLKP